MVGLKQPKTKPGITWPESKFDLGWPEAQFDLALPETKYDLNWAEALSAYGPTNYTSATPQQLATTQASWSSYTPSTTSTNSSFLGGVGDWFTDFGKSLRDIGFLGYKDKQGNQVQGWGMPLLNTAFGLGNLYLALKNYGIAKDTLKFQKDAFNKNYAAQRNLINSSLEDRQRRRVQENPNATPVDQYMAKYGVK